MRNEQRQLVCRGIRGATRVAENTRKDILAATKELLEKMVQSNAVDPERLAGVFFTTTSDLNAEFPAVAARQLGWTRIPLLCGHEMAVPGSMTMVIRVMMLYNTERNQEEIVHVYLGDARSLRPELEPLQ